MWFWQSWALLNWDWQYPQLRGQCILSHSKGGSGGGGDGEDGGEGLEEMEDVGELVKEGLDLVDGRGDEDGDV
jgi:hypothetical protein